MYGWGSFQKKKIGKKKRKKKKKGAATDIDSFIGE
jgi:hypothetical protein